MNELVQMCDTPIVWRSNIDGELKWNEKSIKTEKT